jgi:ATP-dependent helicase/nuclease subunit A
MNYTLNQEKAIQNKGHLVVTAGAGSGKTRVLVERYLRLLEDASPEQLLAITFTEKAARELRDRVRQTIEKRVSEVLNDPRSSAQLRAQWLQRSSAIESARIGTFHSFCATLLRSHPVDIGIDPAFSVLDEVETLLLRSEAIEETLSQAVQEPLVDDPRVAACLQEWSLDELRRMLLQLLQQRSDARQLLAQPSPSFEPSQLDHALAASLSMWQQAQERAAERLQGSDAWQQIWGELSLQVRRARSDDKLGQQVLDLVAANPAWPEPCTLDELQTLRAQIATINLTGGSKKNWPDDSLASTKEAMRQLRDLSKSYGAYLDRNFNPQLEQRAALLVLGLSLLFWQSENSYSASKDKNDQLDFDDLESKARQLLEQHAHVRKHWQAELTTILVDEFQDTNDNQRAIVYSLAGIQNGPAAPAHSGQELFIVGDGKQSIYRFRGADVSVFRNVERDIAAIGGEPVALDTSFRSHAGLVELFNTIFETIFARPSGYQDYEVPFSPLLAHRPHPEHQLHCQIHILGSQKEESSGALRDREAELLVEQIQALVHGNQPIVFEEGRWRVPHYGDFVFLLQASSVFEHYERALERAKIPFLTTAGRGYYGRKEVRDLIHLLRVLDDPSDELALVGVLRSPLFALSDADLLRLRFSKAPSLWQALQSHHELEAPTSAFGQRCAFACEVLNSLQQQRGKVRVVSLLRQALDQTGYLATISRLNDGERRRVNVEKLLMAARNAGGKGLSQWSLYLEQLLRQETRESDAPLEAQGSVRLMTVHRSKGLEFPIVVLPDLGRAPHTSTNTMLLSRDYKLSLKLRNSDNDFEPSAAFQLAQLAEQQSELAERQRLLYVALTRAQDYLILSGKSGKNNESSDWLSQVRKALDQTGYSRGLAVFEH